MSPEAQNTISGIAPAITGAELLARAEKQSGPVYWRSLSELAGTKEVDTFVHREFPSQAHALLDPVSRRNFLRVMGASMMLGGLAQSCARQPSEQILPYVKPPEYTLPGRATFYATALTVAQGFGMGVVATVFEGRPTHLSGLPEHPASLGGITPQVQAQILSLYDPDRLDAILENGTISTYGRFVSEVAKLMESLDATEGEGLRILTESVTSPTLAWQLDKVRALYPSVQWHQWEPVNRDSARAGAELAFGRAVETRYNFREARAIVALDAQFLCVGPAQARYSRDFAYSRDVDQHADWMSRLYVAESTPSLVGATADHKISVRYPDVETLARLIARGVGVQVEVNAEAEAAIDKKFVEAIVKDLTENKGLAVVVPGEQQPAVVHALAHAINAAVGATAPVAEGAAALVEYTDPVEAEPVNQLDSLKTLVQDMNDGKVKALVILGGNPVYNAPADLDFLAALQKVGTRIMLTNEVNETSWWCHWQIPMAHQLESWSDIRSYDGMISIVQPLISPMRGGRTAHEILAILTGEEKLTSHDVVQAYWTANRGADGFDKFWQDALMRGFAMRELLPLASNRLRVKGDFGAHNYVARNGLDVVFSPDPSVGDGSMANNGWLQELPKPLTHLTWDNAVLIHPKTATQLGLNHEELVNIEYNGRTVQGAVMYAFGHPRDAITVHTGYGRTRCGHVGENRGFNAYALQTSESPWFGTGAKLTSGGSTYRLATTDEHWQIEQSMITQGQKAEDRHLVREGSFALWKEESDFAQHMGHHEPDYEFTLYEPKEKDYTDPKVQLDGKAGHRWAMTIDLNKCHGCSACVTACMSENNIPIVGKDQVLMGREMLWIRVDRYYRGNTEDEFYGNPEVSFQPMTCQQCENAPCEPVCPVGATMHSDEGLNDMVYNRCIGTRYCANNCPYKVRRFNFFHYQIREGQDAPSLKMMRNPNVTVRSRGVMEKCTYCVQRINIARIDSKRRDIERERIGEGVRGIEDGTIQTACQQACPSGAILFGDLSDGNSAVAKSKQNPRNYGVIADIGTRPRTTYLAKLRNPSPLLGGGEAHHGTEH